MVSLKNSPITVESLFWVLLILPFQSIQSNEVKSEPLDDDVGDKFCLTKETVLDGLVRTLLSQNTTEINSKRAFDSLKSAFPTWENVLAAV